MLTLPSIALALEKKTGTTQARLLGPAKGVRCELGPTTFASFDALARARDWRPAVERRNVHEARDNARFLEQIVDRYYAVAVGAVRRHDPHHLVFGDKLNGNMGVPEGVMDVIAPHVDALFCQFYGYCEPQELEAM